MAKTAKRKPEESVSDVVKWPADQVERRAVAELVPYARNARKHSAAQVDKIAASIREFGWTVPVLVDEAGGIIAGHGRILSAQKLGIEEVPVMVARGWSESQKRAYVIADNKLTLDGEWDDELLRIELGDLAKSDFDVTLTGFDEKELAKALREDLDSEQQGNGGGGPVVEAGDVWKMGHHKLLVGDDDIASAERAITRWQEATGNAAVLEETGETFAQVMARRQPGMPVGSKSRGGRRKKPEPVDGEAPESLH